MRSECGKGTIKLIVILGLILVVVLGGLLYTRKAVKDEEKKDLQADLLLIQAKIEIVKGKNSINKDENPLKGIQLTQLPEDININEFLSKNVITQEEYEKYYLLNNQALEEMELKELINRYDGYFLVNYENYEIIYSQGYENSNGMWVYKISDLNKMPPTPSVNEAIPASTKPGGNIDRQPAVIEQTNENEEQIAQ